MVLEKTPESPLDSKEIKPDNLKGEYSLEGQMLKLKLQYFGHLISRAFSLEKTLLLGKIGGEGDNRWYNQFNGHEFEQTLGDSGGQKSLVCYSHKELDTT